MKKVMMFVAALAIAMSLASCQGREAQIREKAEYIMEEVVEASANQDLARMEELVEEQEAFLAGLTEEEKEIYNLAALEAGSDLMNDILNQL